MVVGYGVGYALEQQGLSCLGRRYDEHALALAYGREHVHDTAADVAHVSVAEQVELLVREERGQEIERHAVPDIFGGASVHGLDVHEREVLVAFAGRAYLAGHGVAALEGVVLDLLLRNVDVVGGIQIIVVGGAEETVSVRHYLQHSGGLDGLFEIYLLRFLLLEILLPVLASVISAVLLVFLPLVRILLEIGLLLSLFAGLAGFCRAFCRLLCRRGFDWSGFCLLASSCSGFPLGGAVGTACGGNGSGSIFNCVLRSALWFCRRRLPAALPGCGLGRFIVFGFVGCRLLPSSFAFGGSGVCGCVLLGGSFLSLRGLLLGRAAPAPLGFFGDRLHGFLLCLTVQDGVGKIFIVKLLYILDIQFVCNCLELFSRL